MNTNATKSTLSIDDADASQRKSSSSKSSALPTKSTHQHHDVAVATEEKAKTEGTKVGANYVARAFPKNDNDSKKKEPKYKHAKKRSEEHSQAIRDRQLASFHAEDTTNPIAIAQNVRRESGTTWPQLVATTTNLRKFRFDRQARTLTCPRKYVDKFCIKLEIEYRSFVGGMRQMGFNLISSTSGSADMVFTCPSNFDPIDPEKILQLKVDSNATRGKGTGRNSHWGFNEIDNLFRYMNDNKETILKVSFKTYFRENQNLIDSIAEGRDSVAVTQKVQHLLNTTNTKKVFEHPLFQSILDHGAEVAIPEEDKRKKAAASTNAADGASASVLNNTSKKRKAKTTSTASTYAANGANGKENKANTKPTSNKKHASEKSTEKKMEAKTASPEMKSAPEDSMKPSAYSSDEDEAESPEQWEMNSDEDSDDSSDEDSTSDEDEEWVLGMP